MTDLQDGHSVTRFIRDLKEGQNITVAQVEIFRRYFKQLDALATLRLGRIKRVVDGEDIAVRTMQILFEMAEKGGLSEVANREHLLALLKRIARFDAINAIERESAAKRRPEHGFVVTQSVLDDPDSCSRGINNVPDQRCSDDNLESQLNQAFEAVAKLNDEKLRTVASLRLQGLSAREIADQLDVSKRTAERLLVRLFETLQDEIHQPEA